VRWLKIGAALPSPIPGLDPVTCLHDDPVGYRGREGASRNRRESSHGSGPIQSFAFRDDQVMLGTQLRRGSLNQTVGLDGAGNLRDHWTFGSCSLFPLQGHFEGLAVACWAVIHRLLDVKKLNICLVKRLKGQQPLEATLICWDSFAQ
jgi:hypothetical protein